MSEEMSEYDGREERSKNNNITEKEKKMETESNHFDREGIKGGPPQKGILFIYFSPPMWEFEDLGLVRQSVSELHSSDAGFERILDLVAFAKWELEIRQMLQNKLT